MTPTMTAKTEKAVEILTSKLGREWTVDMQEAVEARVRTCDGKDTPTQIARWGCPAYRRMNPRQSQKRRLEREMTMTTMITVDAAAAHFAGKGMILQFHSYNGRKLASTGAIGAVTLYAPNGLGEITSAGSAEVFETSEGPAMTQHNFDALDDPAALLAKQLRA